MLLREQERQGGIMFNEFLINTMEIMQIENNLQQQQLQDILFQQQTDREFEEFSNRCQREFNEFQERIDREFDQFVQQSNREFEESGRAMLEAFMR